MSDFSGTLIVSDLDNTFLGRASRLVPENLAAIEFYKAQGGKFTFATGRDPYALTRVVPGVARIANFPCIMANGAYVFDLSTGAIMGEIGLDKDKFIPIFRELLRRFPDIGARISTRDGFIVPHTSDKLAQSLAAFSDVTEVLPLEQIPRDIVWHKAVLTAGKERIEQVRAYLATPDMSAFSISSSCDELFEIMDQEATKGNKIALLKGLSDTPLIVYGVGDYENDLALLCAADVACCPQNALPEVRDMSDIILCDHDRGAIADLIKKMKSSQGGQP